MRVARIVGAAALVAACGESKPAAESAPAPAGSAMRMQPPPPDRIGAAPEMTVKTGDKVSWDGGAVMQNFTAKALGRTFDSIIFAGKVSVVH